MSSNKKILLVTTPLKETRLRNNNESLLLLGEWCKDYSVENFYIKSDYVIDYHRKDRNAFDCDYKYLEKFNDRLLVSIVDLLNNYHGTDKTVRYWRIILGPWLLTYISSIWDHWESLRIAFDKNNFDKTILFNKDPFMNFSPLNYSDAVDLITNSDLWNHTIFSKILKTEYSNNIKFEYINYHKKNKSLKQSKNSRKVSLKYRISPLVDKLLSAIQKNENIVFFNTYFGLWPFVKVCLKLRCIPRFHSEFNQYIEMPKASKRSNLHLNFKVKNKFEKFLVSNIIQDIPISYIEGFSAIFNNVKDISKKCEIVFTANAFWSNDTFKIFCANKSELGVKIIISEHGGAIGFKYTNFSHEDKISDIYAVWHKVQGGNRVRVQPNIISNKYNYKISGSDLLVIGLNNPLYIRSYQSGIEGSLTIEDYKQKIVFIKSLNKNIQKLVKIRIFDDHGWKIKQRYSDDLSSSSISSCVSFKKAINHSKIIVCTYPETTFLEAMHSKVPTIMLFKMEYYEFHPEFKKLVKVLVGAGILFDNPNDASSHINKIWKDPELWWNQPKTINARKMFFEYCGCVDKDWSNSWVSFFKEVRGLKVTE